MMKEIKEFDPFTPNQTVWLIDSNPVESDKIRSGLSPRVTNISNFDELSHVISERLSNEDAFGTLIVTDNYPVDIKLTLDGCINALNNDDLNPRLFIFDITVKNHSAFNNAIISKDIDDFLEKANDIHIERISDSSSIDEESKNIIKNLKIKNNRLESLLESQKHDNSVKDSKIDDLEQDLKILEKKINDLDFEKTKLEKKNDSLINEQKELKTTIDIEQEQNDSLNKELNDFKKKEIQSKAKLISYQNQIKDLNVQNNKKDQSIIDLKNDLQEERNRSIEYLKSKTELSGIDKMNQQMNALKELLQEQKDKNFKLLSENNLLNEKISQKDERIEQLRNNTVNTNLSFLDTGLFKEINLSRIPIIYFKIIDDLPFINYYIDQLEDYLRYSNQDREIIDVILKIDEGNDEQRYQDRSFIGSLSGINSSEQKYYFIPSNKMDRNIEDFEHYHNNSILIIRDYIQNDKIYFDTDDKEDCYIVIQKDKMLNEVYPKLKGQMISYGHNSLLDLKYDKKFLMLTSELKEQEILKRLQPLIINSKVIESYTDLLNGHN